jgi:hypothetical protein
MQSGREMLSNLMANLPSLAAGVSLGQIKGAFAGFPALCVSAGPSLDEFLPSIKELKDKVVIVALDSAVSTLIPAGITPHIVATCDTRKINFEKIRPYYDQLRDSILVYALEANPDNVRGFPGSYRLAVASDNQFIESWLGPALNIDCNLPAMSTVSHTVIYSMIALGADPIVVVGMDMSFPNDKSHAQNAINRYGGLAASEIVELQGTDGLLVRTYRPMIDYARQLEGVIADSPNRVVNTCLSGLFIQGMEVKSLQEITETDLDAGTDVKRLLDGLKGNHLLIERGILSALLAKRRELETYQDQCLQLISKAESIQNRKQNNEIFLDLAQSARAIKDLFDQL